MPAQPAIIFDLGGVLIDWNPRHLYRKIFDDEEEMEQFLATICTPAWNAQQDAGRPFAEAVAELTAQHPAHAGPIRAYHERWPEMVADAIAGTVTILDELRRAGYTLAALSNWSAETFPLIRPQFPFLDWFELIVLSGEERCIKPDPALYQILLSRLDRSAEDCLFIDDAEKNIIAARQLGFQAIHFQSPDQLRAELQALGILAT